MGTRNTENKKAYTLVIADKYYDNLRQIIYYIAEKQKQPLNAINVAKGINKTMSKIIDNPLAYAECENIPTKTKIYREAGYKSWLVIFKVKSKQVTILGVLSGKQKAATFKSLTRQTLN
jgi:plasmid stabilization system protein ParE